MSVKGDYYPIPASNAQVLAYAWHTKGGTTYTNVASSSSTKKVYNYNPRYFSYNNGVFTCKKPGTYYIQGGGRGGYTSSGGEYTLYYRVYAAGTNVKSSTSITNSGVSFGVSVTLAAGDTVYAQTRNNTGSVVHDFAYMISKSAP